MLVEPRAPKQKIKRGFQVDDVEFHIENDRADGEGNNRIPKESWCVLSKDVIPFIAGMISLVLNPSFSAVRKGQTLRPDALSTSEWGMRKVLNCTVRNRGWLWLVPAEGSSSLEKEMTCGSAIIATMFSRVEGSMAWDTWAAWNTQRKSLRCSVEE